MRYFRPKNSKFWNVLRKWDIFEQDTLILKFSSLTEISSNSLIPSFSPKRGCFRQKHPNFGIFALNEHYWIKFNHFDNFTFHWYLFDQNISDFRIFDHKRTFWFKYLKCGAFVLDRGILVGFIFTLRGFSRNKNFRGLCPILRFPVFIEQIRPKYSNFGIFLLNGAYSIKTHLSIDCRLE